MHVEWVIKNKAYNAKQFRERLGYDLDLRRPQTINDKLNWLKFNYRDPLMVQCAAKDTMRDYVRRRLGAAGDRLLPRLLGGGVYRSADHIDFEALPDQFALKVNNTSGKNLLCADRATFDTSRARAQLREWTERRANHYFLHFEWPYRPIATRILAEEFLGPPASLRHYGLYCFNGRPELVVVSQHDHDKNSLARHYLTLDWRDTGLRRRDVGLPASPFSRPSFFDDMIDWAGTLCEPFPFVRVDFLGAAGVPYLSELTFFPNAGFLDFVDHDHDLRLGAMLDLPPRRRPARVVEIFR